MSVIPSYFPPAPGADAKADVATKSGERAAMDDDLDLINDIRAGAPAMRARCNRYLPQYAKEDSADYRRVDSAPWRREFVDALLSLASKPFSKPVTLAEGTPKSIADLAEDIDGRGNNLHTFAHQTFLEGLANGVHVILVSFPEMTWGPTLADYKAASPRPYWLQIPISSVVACYTEIANGRERVVHLRYYECAVVRDGFGERVVKRVRVLEPDQWELWELQKDDATSKETWVMIESGPIRLGVDKAPDEVHAVLFFTGERKGAIQVKPPLRDIADMQVELYRALSRQDEILTYAGSPMLSGVGMAQPDPKAPMPVVTVGPKSVLLAPENGSWGYISPDAACIKEIREHVASVTDELRHLAMQPTVVSSAGVAATTSIVDAAKAHSALQAWALNLKDALEHAFTFTELWMNETQPTTVNVNTDFAAGLQTYQEASVVLEAEKNSVISKQTARGELQRRSILGPQVDLENEDALLAGEQQGLAPEQPIDPRTGRPIDPAHANVTTLVA